MLLRNKRRSAAILAMGEEQQWDNLVQQLSAPQNGTTWPWLTNAVDWCDARKQSVWAMNKR